MKRKIIDENKSLTFSDYFKLNISAQDVAEHFGYEFGKDVLEMPKSNAEVKDLATLAKSLELSIKRIDITSEIAQREFLIAPILVKLIEITDIKIRPEFHLEVNNQLKGTFDYLLDNKVNFLLIEAKNGDLKRGFTQLTAEMIAFDIADQSEQEIIYGAISIGDVWRFGKLIRKSKSIYEDINSFSIPSNLDAVIKILVGILEGK
jgi:hypothetical protein